MAGREVAADRGRDDPEGGQGTERGGGPGRAPPPASTATTGTSSLEARRRGMPCSRVSSVWAWISTPGMPDCEANGVGKMSCRVGVVAPTRTILPAKTSGGTSPVTIRW